MKAVFKKTFLALGVTAALSAPAFAVELGGPMDHSAHEPKPKAEGPADIYAPAMEKMHKDMMIAPTGDADADFIRGMIPHHQGAIDMAKIQLEKGKDEDVKRLAREIIAAQEKEIAMMKDWLKSHSY